MKIDDTLDIGGHVVAMNRLMTDLIREARQTFKPDDAAIKNLDSEIKNHASMIEHILEVKK